MYDNYRGKYMYNNHRGKYMYNNSKSKYTATIKPQTHQCPSVNFSLVLTLSWNFRKLIWHFNSISTNGWTNSEWKFNSVFTIVWTRLTKQFFLNFVCWLMLSTSITCEPIIVYHWNKRVEIQKEIMINHCYYLAVT